MAEADTKTLSEKLKMAAAADNKCHQQFPFEGDDSFDLLARGAEAAPYCPISPEDRAVEP
ncbi:MAG TPA: hypothetical protein PKI93_05935 [Alphaproteobacteria bacterium]|nr:hypothetical protein [Alphaproteobacteria bacterium]HNS43894.1 hypothetical protein [Alphaproteobacteria bacterium]